MRGIRENLSLPSPDILSRTATNAVTPKAAGVQKLGVRPIRSLGFRPDPKDGRPIEVPHGGDSTDLSRAEVEGAIGKPGPFGFRRFFRLQGAWSGSVVNWMTFVPVAAAFMELAAPVGAGAVACGDVNRNTTKERPSSG